MNKDLYFVGCLLLGGVIVHVCLFRLRTFFDAYRERKRKNREFIDGFQEEK